MTTKTRNRIECASICMLGALLTAFAILMGWCERES